jgi:hypothetical protein
MCEPKPALSWLLARILRNMLKMKALGRILTSIAITHDEMQPKSTFSDLHNFTAIAVRDE